MRNWLGLIVAGMVIVTITGCAKSVKTKTGVSDESETISVRTQAIAAEDFSVQLKLSGTTEPIQDVMISALQGGYVEALNVNVGDAVRQGQVMAEISAAMAKAQFQAASAALVSARSNYERQQELNKQDLTSAQMLEGARAQYEAARAQYEVAKVNLDHAVIRAPFSGRIAARYRKLYEMTSPGAPVFNLVDASRLKLNVGVNESDIGLIQKGMSVTVNISSIGRSFSGVISQVGVKADAMNHTFPVEVVFDNPGLVAPAGAVGDVLISTDTFPNSVAVRQDYILTEGQESYVFVVSGNVAARTSVEVGPRGVGDKFLIKAGLNAGDSLIIEGQRSVKDGGPVKVVE